MPFTEDRPASAGLLRVVRVLVAVATLVAGTVLLGWIAGLARMVNPFPGAAMQFNTALAAVLLGAALNAQTLRVSRLWVVVPSILAGALAAGAALAYGVGWFTGLDQLGFALGVPERMRSLATDRMVATGRMAPHTALALLALSLGILGSLPNPRRTRLASVYFGAVAAAVGILGLFSYASGAEVPAGWANVSRMALPTAIVLVLLGTSLALRGRSALGSSGVALYVHPMLALVAGITLSIGAWQMLMDFNRAQVDDGLRRQISAAIAQVEQHAEQRVRALERLALRAPLLSPAELNADARRTRLDFSGIDAISWADRSSVVVGLEPLDSNRQLLRKRMLDDALRAPAVRAVRETRVTSVTSPFEFTGRGRSALVVVPILDDPRHSYLLGRLNLARLFDAILADERTFEGALFVGSLTVREQDGDLIYGAVSADRLDGTETIQRSVAIRNLHLRMEFRPSKAWAAARNPAAITVVLVVGLVLSAALAVLFLLWERGRAQGAALEQSEERLRLALEGTNDGLFDWDIRKDRVYFSPRWKEMLGYTDAELANEFSTWVDRVHPDDRERALGAIETFRAGSAPQYTLEHRLRHKDGTYRWILARGLGMRDREGKLVRLIGSHADMTIRRTLEESLHERTAELQRSNEELERFAYAASHDLQEPLRMVISFSRLLERQYAAKLDDKAREYIAYAVDGATRMQVMINDLLQYSRVNSRGAPLKVVDTELVFTQALRNLAVAIAESGATVTHDPLPAVMGDATQMLQVFQNLIGNAVKFRGEATPAVHVSAKLVDHRWQFSVRDNGIGLEPKFRDRIFVIFQRLHPRGQYPGNGIGLSICKRIIERHGGAIWVESAPGQGSTFHFTLAPAEEATHGNDAPGQRAA